MILNIHLGEKGYENNNDNDNDDKQIKETKAHKHAHTHLHSCMRTIPTRPNEANARSTALANTLATGDNHPIPHWNG